MTNDAYGHRYGCQLIVRCGHTLPTIFKTSKLYHVGGDVFIAIGYDNDLKNFEEMKISDELLKYSEIEYEGKTNFSVAKGYAFYKEGQVFKDELQKADDEMHKNKTDIKINTI